MSQAYPGRVRGRASGKTVQAQACKQNKLVLVGQESERSILMLNKAQERAARAAANQPRLASGRRNMFGGFTLRSQGRSTKSLTYNPHTFTKCPLDDDERLVHRQGVSSDSCMEELDYYTSTSSAAVTKLVTGAAGALTKVAAGQTMPTGGNGESAWTIPARTYAAALVGKGVQGPPCVTDAADTGLSSGRCSSSEEVVVEVGLGPSTTQAKVSEGGSTSEWASSAGSRRNSGAGAMLTSFGRRVSHVATHTVPKKARRVSEAVAGLGSDVKEVADIMAGRLRASSTKLTNKMESAAQRAGAKMDEAKGWLAKVGAEIKSLLVCGSSNLPVEV